MKWRRLYTLISSIIATLFVLKVNGPRSESVELPAKEQVGTRIININQQERHLPKWTHTSCLLRIQSSRFEIKTYTLIYY
jgi:hypothetical protein